MRDLMMNIKKIISDLTEIELDMLDDDMRFESELGIDSIKKITLVQKIMDAYSPKEREKIEEKYDIGTFLEISSISEMQNLMLKIESETLLSDRQEQQEPLYKVKKVISGLNDMPMHEILPEANIENDLKIVAEQKVKMINEIFKEYHDGAIDMLCRQMDFDDLLNLQLVRDYAQLLEDLDTKSNEELKESNRSTPKSFEGCVLAELPVNFSQYLFLVSYWATGTLSLVSRVELKARFDKTALLWAWKKLLKTNTMLRGYFYLDDNGSRLSDIKLLLESNFSGLKLPEYDLTGMNRIQQNKVLEDFRHEIINRKFNIFAFPLHQFFCFRLSDDSFAIMLANNHLISDGMSNQLILTRLISLYDACLSGGDGLNEVEDDSKGLLKETGSSMMTGKNYSIKMASRIQKYCFMEGRKTMPTDTSEEAFGNIHAQCFHLSKAELLALDETSNYLGLSLYSVLVGAYALAAHRIEKDGHEMTLSLPTGGRVSSRYDFSGFIGCFALNLTPVISNDLLETGDTRAICSFVKETVSEMLVNEADIKQSVEIANELKKQKIFSRKTLAATVAKYARDSVKTNLYMSYVGDVAFQESYDCINVQEYYAYTGTNAKTIDVLVEKVRGKLQFSVNYDANYYGEMFISEFIDTYRFILTEFRTKYQKEFLISLKHPQIVDRSANGLPVDVRAAGIMTLVEAIIHEKLGIVVTDHDESLSMVHGMTSIEKIKLMASIISEFSVNDKIKLFQANTIREVAMCLSDYKKPTSVALAPAQLWIFERFDPPYRWCGYTRFVSKDVRDPQKVMEAIRILVKRNDALRMVFVEKDGVISPFFAEDITVDIKYYELPNSFSADEYEANMDELIENEVQSFSIDRSPLIKFRVIMLKDGSQEFVVIAHHLILDYISDGILFEQIWKYYDDVKINGSSEKNCGFDHSFQDYITTVYGKYIQMKEDIDAFWLGELQDFRKAQKTTFPFYDESRQNLEMDERKTTVTLSVEETNRLKLATEKHKGCSPYDMVLAALYDAIAQVSENPQVVFVSQRVHGRLVDGKSYMSVAGNMAINYPLKIQVRGRSTTQLAIDISNKRRLIPMNGVSYDLCGKSVLNDAYPDNALTIIRANYLGNVNEAIRVDDQFAFNREKWNQRKSLPNEKRASDIEFFFWIEKNRFVTEVAYPSSRCDEESIKRVLHVFLNDLRELISLDRQVDRQYELANKGTIAKNVKNRRIAIVGGNPAMTIEIADKYLSYGDIVTIISKNTTSLKECQNSLCEKYRHETIFGFAADVGDYYQMQSVLTKAVAYTGGIDILIFAPYINETVVMDDMYPKEWADIIGETVIGAINTVHAALLHLKKNTQSAVILLGYNCSNAIGTRATVNAVVKQALTELAEFLNRDLMNEGVTVNTIFHALANSALSTEPSGRHNQLFQERAIANVICALTSNVTNHVPSENFNLDVALIK
jgi:NAD(P)-dependent dehydrogenase (short-subunit alcohol dehydrogenase family)